MTAAPAGRPRRRGGFAAFCRLVIVLVSAAVVAGVVAARSVHPAPQPAAAPAAPTPATPAATATATAAPDPPRRSARATPRARRPKALSTSARKRLTRTLAGYLGGTGGRLAIAVRDLPTGAVFRYGTAQAFPTASIVKVDILAALLLKAQRAGRPLTADERATAARMIQYSDNLAANALWDQIGGTAGLTAVNRRLGLRATTAGPGGYWGVTMTGTADQVRLLWALVSRGSPLNARSRRYALELMGSVTPAQRWGISAGAAGGDAVALKNGWLPRVPDGGTWVINSIGRIRGGGRDFLIAVLSDHNVTMAGGIARVEQVTRLVTKALGHT
ncbi:serine hydrolase [Actinomadura scrupuli]|uniref:serine hydrolase n=1 Tax=Actinomadura scrupuli TaxID=559629 RepID=UPI003D970382